MLSTTSGLPMLQPSTNWGAGGRSLASPFGAPASTHLTRVLISLSESRRSFSKCVCLGSANQGGIVLATTFSLIERAQGRASSYVNKDIGATSPARWHSTQLL